MDKTIFVPLLGEDGAGVESLLLRIIYGEFPKHTHIATTAHWSPDGELAKINDGEFIKFYDMFFLDRNFKSSLYFGRDIRRGCPRCIGINCIDVTTLLSGKKLKKRKYFTDDSKEIGLPMLTVLTKADLLGFDKCNDELVPLILDRYGLNNDSNTILVSAKTGFGIEKLITTIVKKCKIVKL